MATPAIEIENVSKLYKLGYYGADTFRDEIANFFRRLAGKPPVNALVDGQGTNKLDSVDNTDLVWALKDINLTINQGDIVGIIGKNGAGKSTLLKILSKITTPTTGQIKINGRMASLLEVGTGMNPELTGRENIFLNGAILGMTKQEIKSKLDEIIDFSGIAKYADTPIKRYSSGMRVRLGFAIAAFLEPEILVVDEVLAVGDAEFQKKAIGKMQDISKGNGRTVLFVSHNMASIRTLCRSGILLENGTVKKQGDIESIVEEYISGYNLNIRKKEWEINPLKEISITNAELIVEDKNENQLIDLKDNIKIRIKYFVKEDISGTNIGFTIFREGVDLFRSWDIDLNPELFEKRKKGTHISEFSLPNILMPGVYSIRVATGKVGVGFIDIKDDCIQFEISNIMTDERGKSFTRKGMIKVDVKWDDKII